jgi:hypothetical protein
MPLQSVSVSVGSQGFPGVDAEAASEPPRARGGSLSTITWFGFLTGWLELGLVLSRRIPGTSSGWCRFPTH